MAGLRGLRCWKNSVAKNSNDLWNNIPEDVKKLLFTSNANMSNARTDDPSTIYFKAPITIPVDPELVPRPSYYPSYAGLEPEQRYIYINWLHDISSEIDVGYKFIFYYGLERHLLLGDLENAFDMIIRLRKSTTNDSFLTYSVNALICSLMLRRRADLFYKLAFLYSDSKWYYNQLLVKVLTDDTINATELMRLLKTHDVNKRYITNEPELYTELMDSLLFEKYGHLDIRPSDYIRKSPSKVREGSLFANISLSEEYRYCMNIPMLDTSKFYACITELHSQCHELVKARLAGKREKALPERQKAHKHDKQQISYTMDFDNESSPHRIFSVYSGLGMTFPNYGTPIIIKIAGGPVKLDDEVIIYIKSRHETTKITKIESKVIKIIKSKKLVTEANVGDKVSLVLEELPIKELNPGAVITKYGSAKYYEMEKLIHSRELEIEQLAIEALEG
jgi:hypothetical protein